MEAGSSTPLARRNRRGRSASPEAAREPPREGYKHAGLPPNRASPLLAHFAPEAQRRASQAIPHVERQPVQRLGTILPDQDHLLEDEGSLAGDGKPWFDAEHHPFA